MYKDMAKKSIEDVGLTTDQKTELGLLPTEASHDVAFIRRAIIMIFSPDKIKILVLKKRKKRNCDGLFVDDGTEEIAPSQKLKLMNLFSWRLRKLNLTEEELDKRNSMIRLNELISKSLCYLKSKETCNLSDKILH